MGQVNELSITNRVVYETNVRRPNSLPRTSTSIATAPNPGEPSAQPETAEACFPAASSAQSIRTSVSRIEFPDGSRKPESIP